MVESLGSYSNIKKILTNIKIFNSLIKDKDIAHWIRLIMQGETLTDLPIEINLDRKENLTINFKLKKKNEILNYLVKISYLMFGTEVTRNPAALIHS